MTLALTDAFSLRPPGAENNEREQLRRSEIVCHGIPTGTLVAGIVLEAALRCDVGFLLFLSDDILHEDSLRIYLIDEHYALTDSATLGAMYATGAFSDLQIISPSTLRFRFFGDTTWTLEVFPHRRWRLLPAPRGVHRPLRFHQHFRLDGSPLHG